MQHNLLFAPFGRDDDGSGGSGFRKPWERDTNADHFKRPWKPRRNDFHGGGFRKPWERDGASQDRTEDGGEGGGFHRKPFRKPFDGRGGARPYPRKDGGFRKPWERDNVSYAAADEVPGEHLVEESREWDRSENRYDRNGNRPFRKSFRSARSYGDFQGKFRRDVHEERKPWEFERKPWQERAERPERLKRHRRTAPIPAEGEMLFGRQPVREVLRAARRPVHLLVLADGVKDSPEVADIRALCQEKDIRIAFYRREDLEAWTNGANHQGVVLFCADYPYVELDEIVADLDACEGNGIVMVLDHIIDPQNLGSILRTCECAGVLGIVLPTDRAVGVTPAAVRASAGAAEHIKIARISNLVTALERFKGAGAWITGLEALPESRGYSKVDYIGKVCLVVGSEAHGICTPVRRKCDFLVRLPMCGSINSLNAGVAAALAIYEVLRQQGVEGNGMPAREPVEEVYEDDAGDAAEEAVATDGYADDAADRPGEPQPGFDEGGAAGEPSA